MFDMSHFPICPLLWLLALCLYPIRPVYCLHQNRLSFLGHYPTLSRLLSYPRVSCAASTWSVLSGYSVSKGEIFVVCIIHYSSDDGDGYLRTRIILFPRLSPVLHSSRLPVPMRQLQSCLSTAMPCNLLFIAPPLDIAPYRFATDEFFSCYVSPDLIHFSFCKRS